MLIVSCVEFIPLQLPTTVSFKCVLISINFSASFKVCKQQQTASDNRTFVYAYNLLVLGLNGGSPSEEKTSMKKHFVHSLMGHCFRLVVIPINMKLCPCIIPINIFQLQSL